MDGSVLDLEMVCISYEHDVFLQERDAHMSGSIVSQENDCAENKI
jgi:hypothetical protein